MYCMNCGSKVADGAAFCSGCGTKMAGAAPQSMAPQGQPMVGYGAPQAQPNPSGAASPWGQQNPNGAASPWGQQNAYGQPGGYGQQYGGQYGGQYGAQPQKKSHKALFITLGAVGGAILLGLLLFFLLRGLGADKGLAQYKGTWTCVSVNSAYIQDRYEFVDVASIEIDSKTAKYHGNFNFNGLDLDDFEYIGDSGVNMVDGQEFYNARTDQFLPLVKYEYYANREAGVGYAIGKLEGGDMVILELEDWFSDNPLEYTYALTFQKAK